MTRKSNSADDTEHNRRKVLESVGCDGDEANTGRRSVLRSVAATALATVGFTNTAAAIETSRTAELRFRRMQYRSTDSVRTAIETHGEDLLELLGDHGYLDSSVEELLGEDVTVRATRFGDTTTAHIEATKELADGKLTVIVEPERGRSYAVERTDGDVKTLRTDASGDSTTLSVEPTDTKYSCRESITCSYCEKAEVSCDGGTCEIVSFTGECCTSCDSTCGC